MRRAKGIWCPLKGPKHGRWKGRGGDLDTGKHLVGCVTTIIDNDVISAKNFRVSHHFVQKILVSLITWRWACLSIWVIPYWPYACPLINSICRAESPKFYLQGRILSHNSSNWRRSVTDASSRQILQVGCAFRAQKRNNFESIKRTPLLREVRHSVDLF
jgi:hypothetical protein